jgi:hypothetical protein
MMHHMIIAGASITIKRAAAVESANNTFSSNTMFSAVHREMEYIGVRGVVGHTVLVLLALRFLPPPKKNISYLRTLMGILGMHCAGMGADSGTAADGSHACTGTNPSRLQDNCPASLLDAPPLQQQQQQRPRLHFMDWMRVFLTVVVIAHHCVDTYIPTGSGFWSGQKQEAAQDAAVTWLSAFFVLANEVRSMAEH